MTMSVRSFNAVIILTGFYLSFLSFINADEADSSCSGPTKYYVDIGCTPVYNNPDSPCPEKYNCDHLKNIPTNKCFINGHEYAIGEILRDEDKSPCNIACSCVQSPGGPQFRCAIVDCFYDSKPGCYLKQNATSCCPDSEVCPEKEEDRPTCMVDGIKYKDGEYFEPASEPTKYCYCGEGYTGENIEPFCILSSCGTMLHHIGDIRGNCVPTYYSNQSPKSSCSAAYRCQNDKDVVIPRMSDSTGNSKSVITVPEDPGMMCSFGNLKMRVGDELNQATGYNSVCMKCVCQVPPVPTCQRLSDKECDIRKHPNFD